MSKSHTVSAYATAGYPAVAISTADEDGSINSVMASLQNHNDPEIAKSTFWRISSVGGLRNASDNTVVDSSLTFAGAFAKLAQASKAVLFVLDFQHAIRNAIAYRGLRDSLNAVKARGNLIVLVAPGWQLPAEIEHDVPVIHDALPSREELARSLDTCLESIGVTDLDEVTRGLILDAASGLTLSEAEGAMALSMGRVGGKLTIVPERVADEKMKLVRQSGYLEVSAAAKVDDLGGLGGFRNYIEQEIIRCLHNPLLRVRGVLLVGVPGTGKSLAAKVLSAMLRRPIVRCDIGALKNSKVGDSERAMREALKMAEAVSPIVLWFDEIEKGVGGVASSANTDSGVTLGMVGHLLTWMQEHTADILVVMTCNKYELLPAELTRAGRIDERFFVDLPGREERREIALVHLKKWQPVGALLQGDDPQESAECAAGLSDGWTGAEIEQLVRSAARRTNCTITKESLVTCAVDIKPISKVRAGEITALREWGKGNLRMANTPEAAAPTGRKIGKAVSR